MLDAALGFDIDLGTGYGLSPDIHMNEKSIYTFLGLCHRAGAMLSGGDQLMDGLKNKKGKLLLIAEDTSPRTAKELAAVAERTNTPCRVFGKKEELGQALGKGQRSALLILDSGFAKAVAKKLEAGR